MVPCARQVGSRVRLLQASPSASPPRGLLTTGTSGTPIDSYRARGLLPITKPGRGSVEVLRISSAWKSRNGAHAKSTRMNQGEARRFSLRTAMGRRLSCRGILAPVLPSAASLVLVATDGAAAPLAGAP